jgi:hypothetical protein
MKADEFYSSFFQSSELTLPFISSLADIESLLAAIPPMPYQITLSAAKYTLNH